MAGKRRLRRTVGRRTEMSYKAESLGKEHMNAR